MTTTPTDPKGRIAVIREGERDNIWFLGDLVQQILTEKMTEGRFEMHMSHYKPASEPPLHQHAGEDEIFFILEGRVSFWSADVAVTLGAGDCILLPRDVPHIFRSDPETGAKCLVLTAPGRFEGFLRAVAEPATYAAPKQGWRMDKETGARLEKACDDFGITLLGPPGARP